MTSVKISSKGQDFLKKSNLSSELAQQLANQSTSWLPSSDIILKDGNHRITVKSAGSKAVNSK